MLEGIPQQLLKENTASSEKKQASKDEREVRDHSRDKYS